MTRKITVAILGVFLAGLPALTGCDDKTTVKHESVEKKADGTTVTKEQKQTTDNTTGESKTKTETKVEKP